MMSPRERVECSTGLIYIGLALRQRGLFIKTTLTALLGAAARHAGARPTAPHYRHRRLKLPNGDT